MTSGSPPAKKVQEARVFGRASTAEKDEGLNGSPFVWGEVVLDLRDPICD